MTVPSSDAAVVYMPPIYLRTPIREYLAVRDSGIYWLRGPKDAGKTQFVRGIVERRPSPKDPATQEGIDSNLASDLRSIGFFIRKESPDGPRQLVEGLAAAFATEMRLGDEERAGLVPSIRFADPAEARADLLAWLAKLHAALVVKGAKRLMVCIDALDAVTEPGGAFAEPYSLLDLLPAASELPPGVLLTVTSRPAAECPAGLFERIAQKLGEGVTARDITLQDKDYVELLQKYFREKLRPRFRTRCVKYWNQMLESKAKFEKGGRDQRLTDDPGFRDALKDDWKKLTNKYPRYSGIPLPVTTIAGILDDIDKLWAGMLDKTEQRFRLVELFIARVADGSLAFEQVPELPKGDELLGRLQAMAAPAAA